MKKELFTFILAATVVACGSPGPASTSTGSGGSSATSATASGSSSGTSGGGGGSGGGGPQIVQIKPPTCSVQDVIVPAPGSGNKYLPLMRFNPPSRPFTATGFIYPAVATPGYCGKKGDRAATAFITGFSIQAHPDVARATSGFVPDTLLFWMKGTGGGPISTEVAVVNVQFKSPITAMTDKEFVAAGGRLIDMGSESACTAACEDIYKDPESYKELVDAQNTWRLCPDDECLFQPLTGMSWIGVLVGYEGTPTSPKVIGAPPVYVYPDGATAWADVPFDAVHVAN